MAQRPMPAALFGWCPQTPSNGVSSLSLNAAATWMAYGFMIPENKTLSKVKFRTGNVTGTLGASDISVSLYSSSTAGVPNAAIEARTTLAAAIASSQWAEATGFTSALTRGTQYWIVVKNLNATPASNFVSLIFLATQVIPTIVGGSTARQGWAKNHSTDSGGAWANGVVGGSNIRLEFSDGSFAGFPIQAAGSNGTQMVYSTREYGVRVVSPTNAKLNVRGVAMFLNSAVGTPTADPFFKLYTGETPALLASTDSFPRGIVTAAGWYQAYFSAAQVIDANTVMRVMLAEGAQADASANAFRAIEYTIEDNADSKLLMPTGSLKRSYYDGSVWADTDTATPAFALILDSDYEFAALAAAGAYSPIGRRLKWGC